MCGRYTITDSRRVAEAFELDAIEADLSRPRYNIAPTQNVPAVLVRDGARVLVDLHWGLVPSWAKDRTIGARLINARAETLASKPSFRSAFAQRRCLIVADGFYEWARRGAAKQPMYIRVDGGAPFAFAGLYERWRLETPEALASCTIITTEPNMLLKPIHDRMPVILPREAYAAWLDPAQTDPAALAVLLKPFDADWMTAQPVSHHVNSPRHDDKQCIAAIDSLFDGGS